jgi:hypothetical protein
MDHTHTAAPCAWLARRVQSDGESLAAFGLGTCVYTSGTATDESNTAELRTALRATGWVGRVQAHSEQCELAQSMQHERVSRGQTLWQAGELPTAVYLVLEGTMQLLKPVLPSHP